MHSVQIRFRKPADKIFYVKVSAKVQLILVKHFYLKVVKLHNKIETLNVGFNLTIPCDYFTGDDISMTNSILFIKSGKSTLLKRFRPSLQPSTGQITSLFGTFFKHTGIIHTRNISWLKLDFLHHDVLNILLCCMFQNSILILFLVSYG